MTRRDPGNLRTRLGPNREFVIYWRVKTTRNYCFLWFLVPRKSVGVIDWLVGGRFQPIRWLTWRRWFSSCRTRVSLPESASILPRATQLGTTIKYNITANISVYRLLFHATVLRPPPFPFSPNPPLSNYNNSVAYRRLDMV